MSYGRLALHVVWYVSWSARLALHQRDFTEPLVHWARVQPLLLPRPLP